LIRSGQSSKLHPLSIIKFYNFTLSKIWNPQFFILQGKRNTKWHQWTSCHITCRHTVTPTLSLIFILANLRTCPHRTCGTVVSRILVRGSTNYIKNNIKDTNNNSNSNNQIVIRRTLVLPLSSAAIIVVILKSIRKISDLKTIPIASALANAMHLRAIEAKENKWKFPKLRRKIRSEGITIWVMHSKCQFSFVLQNIIGCVN
jgi:hypothetical protein